VKEIRPSGVIPKWILGESFVRTSSSGYGYGGCGVDIKDKGTA
jgi:hypothetical protein